MKKYFVWVILLSIFLTLLESTLFTGFKIGYTYLKVSIVAVIVVSWLLPIKEGVINACIVGALCDVFFGGRYLYYFLVYLVSSLVTNFISVKVNVKKVYVCLILTFITTIMVEFSGYIINFFRLGYKYTTFALSKIIFPQALLNTIVCFIVFYIYKSICMTKYVGK